MDIDFLVRLLEQLNILQLVAIGGIFWFFYSRLDKKIENLSKVTNEKFEKNEKNINERFEKIEKKFDKFEERLTRVENDMIEVKTILRMKECCMIQDDKQMKKAE